MLVRIRLELPLPLDCQVNLAIGHFSLLDYSVSEDGSHSPVEEVEYAAVNSTNAGEFDMGRETTVLDWLFAEQVGGQVLVVGAAWNENPKPFVWTATVASIQEKLSLSSDPRTDPGRLYPAPRQKGEGNVVQLILGHYTSITTLSIDMAKFLW